MRMGCADIFGVILLVVTVLTASVSFVSPYWISSVDADDYVLDKFYLGLLAHCSEQYCEWFVENDFFVLKHLPGTYNFLNSSFLII